MVEPVPSPSPTPATALVLVSNLIVTFTPYDPRTSQRPQHTIFIGVYFHIIINRGGGGVDGRKNSGGRTPSLAYDGNGGGSILRDGHRNGKFCLSTSQIEQR